MDLDLKTILKKKSFLITVLVILFIVFDFYPKIRKLGKLKGEIDLARKSIKTLSQVAKDEQERNLREKLSQAKECLAFIQRTNSAIQEHISKNKNIPLITLEVGDLAELSQIELASIKPLMVQEESGYKIVPVEIGFRSEYAALINFLSRAEKCPTLMTVENFSVSTDAMIYPTLDVNLILYILVNTGEEGSPLDSTGEFAE